ncbi:hypothetical protein DFO45_2280 [Azorhizobium sp. AG788]|uniref:hypothetical protein n=1 Tax=Azorhizobium sp. AG788 TaxID=2183897 RepID=UPI00105C26B8|nr:hypothetical protein [Azorhizobium sp. AG788]TDT94530.1 hypothetical protein DFO45_2280 [Azorhizobium sp. AG788]
MSGKAGKETCSALSVRGDDFYASPPEAVAAFLRAEAGRIPGVIWEPACGDGAIVLPLRAAGHRVIATDLVDRGCPDSRAGEDFLMPFPVPAGVEGIVTNPPFKLAQAFVDRALDVAPYVAMLLRLAFLEGAERKPWFEAGALARVHVSSRRLPMMHRNGWDGPKTGSAIAFAWFVWERAHCGAAEIRWFDWREGLPCAAE